MRFEKGFCRVDTVKKVLLGEITETSGRAIILEEFSPLAPEVRILKNEIISCVAVSEEDIPPYE